MTDETRAVAEVAKATGEIVKVSASFGAYLARVLGSIPANLLGLAVGDWLEHKRRRNLAALEANTARIMERIAVERLTEPSPNVLIPLLQAAVDESRPELQGMWSALLANAMTDGGSRVRRDYFEAVRAMEPVDAAVLDVISRRPNSHSDEKAAADADIGFIEHERVRLGIMPDDQAIALLKLVKLDCAVTPDPPPFAMANMPKAYPPHLTAFGRGLVAACKPPK